ncbi:MAG: branched-chain amino acid ABC transporter substrate-binding protein [Bradyrhizobiaceae bacterium]|nr:MAG: branched-chain amino acid ABC transporter substrate-binding protein [Bradyrhizobiaceae bacterium]
MRANRVKYLSGLAGAFFAMAALLGTAPAMAKDKVRIAFIANLSGGGSHIGLGGRNSADLAIRQRNADPKSKYEYELVSYDDECKPSVGVQVATRVASDDSISAALAHYCSAVAMATIGVFHKFNMPMLIFTAISPEITDDQKFDEVNRVGPSAIDQNRVGPKFMADLGYKTWAVIYDTTAFGTSNDKYFTQFMEKTDGKVLAKFGVSPDQQDFTAELTKIKELNPQVIYLETLAPVAARVRLQMDKLGVNAQFDSVSGVFSDEYIKTLGPLAEGSLSRRNGQPLEDLAGGKAFIEQYAAQKYDQPADVWGHFAYAEMSLLLDVIEKVGPSRDAIVKGLRAVKEHPTLLGPVTFNDHGQNINSTASVVVVQDGKWIGWDKSEYATGKRKLSRLP